MAGRPKHTKPDKNQAEIVEELRALGFDVDDVHNVPGLYDIVVSGERYIPNARNCQYVIECSLRVEIKNRSSIVKASPSEDQVQYHLKQNYKDSYMIAYCTRDILQWFDGIAPTYRE